MKFQIQRCQKEDVQAYAEHARFHLTERGIGDVLVHPFPSGYRRDIPEFVKLLISRWILEPLSPDYEAAWVAVVDGKFVGHLNLRCGSIKADGRYTVGSRTRVKLLDRSGRVCKKYGGPQSL